MRVIGGDYGVGGNARLEDGRGIVVESSVNAVIPVNEIQRAIATEHKQKKFSALGFLIFGLIGLVAGFVFFGFIGAAAGVVVAVALSFTTSTSIRVLVDTTSGKRLEAEGWHYEVQKLIKAANSGG